MKSRKEVAKFIEQQFLNTQKKLERYDVYHYGKLELIELMDFIYENNEPAENEKLSSKLGYNKFFTEG